MMDVEATLQVLLEHLGCSCRYYDDEQCKRFEGQSEYRYAGCHGEIQHCDVTKSELHNT